MVSKLPIVFSGAGARASTAEGGRTGEDTDENGAASIDLFHAH